MRNPMMPLAAMLLLGLAAPALAQQAPAEDAAARTLAQNARVVFHNRVAEQARVVDAAPSVPVAIPRNPPARRLAMASNQGR